MVHVEDFRNASAPSELANRLGNLIPLRESPTADLPEPFHAPYHPAMTRRTQKKHRAFDDPQT